MGPGLAAINLGRSAAVDVFDTLGRKPTIDPTKKGKRIKNLKGKITFKDLFFYYPNSPNRPLFHNLNLTIEPGQSIALVGPSGSGKSTIARFLLRFYDPNQGEIMIDDKYPLTSLNLSWWRSQIGYVAQEPVIFPGTIHNNIAIGKPASEGPPPTTKEVIDAAKMACAHDFILNLPDGYDTYFSGSSVQLSGGQMQRIAIARALIAIRKYWSSMKQRQPSINSQRSTFLKH
jgi:ABC-type multidrug transport system fused ATPase/permease subunit